MSSTADLDLRHVVETLHKEAGIDYDRPIIRNASAAVLYEEALKYEEGTAITSSGALATSSGAKTGRSPKDKRIVDDPSYSDDVWWGIIHTVCYCASSHAYIGPVNLKMSDQVFMINRERAVDYLNTRKRLYVIDGFVMFKFLNVLT